MRYKLFRMAEVPKEPPPIGAIFLGVLAVLLFGVAGVGYFAHEPEPVTGGFLLAGTVLAIPAAFYSRVNGILEVGKDGAKIPIEARHAEQQLKQGKVIQADRLPELLKEFRELLAESRDNPGSAPSPEAEDEQQ